jgi:hypothetical protein
MHVAIRAAIGAGVQAAFSVVKDLLALTTVALVELTTFDFGRGTCTTEQKSITWTQALAWCNFHTRTRTQRQALQWRKKIR